MAFENKPVEQKTSPRKIPLKQWTSTDEITHDFADSENFRQAMLKKHGQYMSEEGARVTA